MQRSSQRSQQNKGHGERNQVAVAKLRELQRSCDPGLKQSTRPSPALCDVLAKGFRGRLEDLDHSPEGNGVPLANPELS